MIDVFKNDSRLDLLTGEMNMNGEELWTVQEILEQEILAPSIALVVMMRQKSKFSDKSSFITKK
ncbi:hypothetical protein [Mycoplasma putrefaciens]|uniref:hypothetical protein n=1 Tax=Mycoplasma putrefaciens TaxID=2123 RepID=UPI000694FBA9|nr:hypothetical protein [Mycoplasma putrefaciens]